MVRSPPRDYHLTYKLCAEPVHEESMRQALVTGNGRMAGAIANRLEADGYAVTRMLGGAEEHGAGVDFADHASVLRAIDGLPSRLDAVVLCHSYAERGTLGDVSPAAWRRMIDYAVTSSYVILQRMLPGLEDGARIVIVSSVAGLDRSRNSGPHVTASKAGLNALVRHLSTEFATRGLRINAICAGLIDDEHALSVNTPDSLEAAVQSIPMKRAGTVDEIAGGVAFLLSDDSTYVTGSLLSVAGGTHP
jgi:NAD(P)-dependent dehydrogenase (short-subunit alcohol dehydrogenase family)